jgi:hypothetical protein
VVWDRYIQRWQQTFPSRKGNHPRMTADRAKLIAKTLKDYPVSALLTAIDAMFDNEWRVNNGFHQLESAIRDAERIDKLLAEADNPKIRERRAASTRGGSPQLVQKLPDTGEGYRSRIHFTDDGWVDADGNPTEPPTADSLARYGRP